mmetsp:Transcript_118085/g.376493  ORF Transcript_118085/g.376493 Transcript_118085/m.376493 type:complete len:281 (-) Transcript_118085:211-1053(-)
MAPAMAVNRYAALASDSDSEEKVQPDKTVQSEIGEETQKKGKAKAKGKKKAKGVKRKTGELQEGEDQLETAKKRKGSSPQASAAAAPVASGAPSAASCVPSDDSRAPAPAAAAATATTAAADADAAVAGPAAAGTKRILEGGVTTEVTRPGKEGAKVAGKGDVVKMLYEGKLPGKKMKSFDKGDIDFVLGDGSMVVGFDRGVFGMAVGERRSIFIPSKYGYGKKGKKPKVPPNSDLVFDVILASVGADWQDMTYKHNCMPVQRREAAKRRGKKAKRSCGC